MLPNTGTPVALSGKFQTWRLTAPATFKHQKTFAVEGLEVLPQRDVVDVEFTGKNGQVRHSTGALFDLTEALVNFSLHFG